MHPITKLKVDFPCERGERFVHLEKQSIHYDNFDQYWFWLDQYWLRALSNLACYCSRNENMLLQTPSSWELFDPIKRKPNNCFGSLASCELLRIKTQALERDRFIFLFCDGGGDDDDGGDDDIVPFTKSITHYYSCSVKAVRRKNINLNIPEITLSYIN